MINDDYFFFIRIFDSELENLWFFFEYSWIISLVDNIYIYAT